MKIHSVVDHLELIDQIAKWHWDEWGSKEDPGGSLESWTRGLRERTRRDEVPTTYVALDEDGNLLGSVTLVDNDMDIRPEYSPWLAGLFVHPGHRHKGIGSALTRHAVSKAGHMGVEILYLYTASARPLYQAMGWREIDSAYYDGKTVSIMAYEIARSATAG